jgi:uncharacterized membrane protein
MSDIALRPALRRSHWPRLLLVASLAVNAFFIGATATDFLRFRRDHDGEGPRTLRFELRWLEGRLPSEGLDRVATAVAVVRPSAEAHIDRMKQLRAGLAELVARPAPDRAAIDARLVEIRGELQAMQSEVQKAVVDALLALSPQMRAELAGASGAAKH